MSAENFPDEAASEFQSALLDPNIASRETARYSLRKNGSLDFTAFYLAKLDRSAGREQLAAVCGLGETGGASDSQFLERFFQSPSAKIRLPTFRGIANLNSDPYTNELVQALKDSSPKVAREAAIFLTKKANSIGLAKIAATHPSEGGQPSRDALHLPNLAPARDLSRSYRDRASSFRMNRSNSLTSTPFQSTRFLS